MDNERTYYFVLSKNLINIYINIVMIDYPNAILKIDDLELADNTKANLNSVLNKLKNNKIKNENKISNYLLSIKDETKGSTYYSYVSAVLSLMTKDIIPKSKDYKKLQDNLKALKLIQDKNRSSAPSEKQACHYIKLEDLQNRVAKITNITDKLLLSLYVDIPPVRLDYGHILIVDKFKDIPSQDDLQNYYAIRENTILLRDYKTKKIYDEYKYKLLPQHKTLIKKIIANTGQKYLFVNSKTNEPYNNNKFGIFLTSVLKKYFDKCLTLLDLRHIYASHYSLEKYGIDKVREVAERMLHSVEENVLAYQKNYDGEN